MIYDSLMMRSHHQLSAPMQNRKPDLIGLGGLRDVALPRRENFVIAGWCRVRYLTSWNPGEPLSINISPGCKHSSADLGESLSSPPPPSPCSICLASAGHNIAPAAQ